MDKIPIQVLSQIKLNEILEIIGEMSREKISRYREATLTKKLASISKNLFQYGTVTYVGFLILQGIQYLLGGKALANTMLATAIVTLTFIWGAFIVNTFSSGITIVKFGNDPHGPILNLVNGSIFVNLKFVDRLAAHDAINLKYVLAIYRQECAAFEKRGNLLSGSLQGVGLFPALATVAATWATLHHFEIWSNWLQFLVPLILAFHFFNLMAFTMRQKMDEVIAVLEYSIEAKKLT